MRKSTWYDIKRQEGGDKERLNTYNVLLKVMKWKGVCEHMNNVKK